MSDVSTLLPRREASLLHSVADSGELGKDEEELGFISSSVASESVTSLLDAPLEGAAAAFPSFTPLRSTGSPRQSLASSASDSPPVPTLSDFVPPGSVEFSSMKSFIETMQK